MIHFGKVSKLSYNSGRALSPVVGGYVCVRPAQSLPRIISTGDYPPALRRFEATLQTSKSFGRLPDMWE